MRRHRTKPACMVRRRSTVRFRNGAPQELPARPGQKLTNSYHPTLRMGAVPVLGGIWEIVFWALVSGPWLCDPANVTSAGSRWKQGPGSLRRNGEEAPRRIRLMLAAVRISAADDALWHAQLGAGMASPLCAGD